MRALSTLSNGARANQSSVFVNLDKFISRISKYAISFYRAIVMQCGDTEMIGSALR